MTTEMQEAPIKTLTPSDTLGADFGANEESSDQDTDTEKATLDLPQGLSYHDGQDKPWEVEFYKGTCLDCDAVVQGGEVQGLKQKCHYMNGNPLCPGKELRVVFIGQRVKLVKMYKDAKASGDPAKVMRALQRINEECDPEALTSVMQEIGLLGAKA